MTTSSIWEALLPMVDFRIGLPRKMVYATYQAMLKEYSSDHISVLGYSSGGNLALGMISYLNEVHLETPKPNQIIAISPGNCLEIEEEEKRL